MRDIRIKLCSLFKLAYFDSNDYGIGIKDEKIVMVKNSNVIGEFEIEELKKITHLVKSNVRSSSFHIMNNNDTLYFNITDQKVIIEYNDESDEFNRKELAEELNTLLEFIEIGGN
ncbi:hypothetical protein Bp8pS_036 [Bacillus phage vB_BpuM-BpSp]|nr:hypothetical protein Bp8pS_036 [Bacillus phage vB_BpuM-BpSp]